MKKEALIAHAGNILFMFDGRCGLNIVQILVSQFEIWPKSSTSCSTVTRTHRLISIIGWQFWLPTRLKAKTRHLGKKSREIIRDETGLCGRRDRTFQGMPIFFHFESLRLGEQQLMAYCATAIFGTASSEPHMAQLIFDWHRSL
jgi:hypothetical protein